MFNFFLVFTFVFYNLLMNVLMLLTFSISSEGYQCCNNHTVINRLPVIICINERLGTKEQCLSVKWRKFRSGETFSRVFTQFKRWVTRQVINARGETGIYRGYFINCYAKGESGTLVHLIKFTEDVTNLSAFHTLLLKAG